jgi:hypothetical protein
MGNISRFHLTITPDTPTPASVLYKELDNDLGTAFSQSNYSEHFGKWYDYEKDMLVFSRKHPTCLFTLQITPEYESTTWKEYYQNGKHYTVEPIVVWPEFDAWMLH